MTIKRSVSVPAFPLAPALVASPALAKSAKEQPKPANNAPLIVDSPNMVTSVRDRHPELNPAPASGKKFRQTGGARARDTAGLGTTVGGRSKKKGGRKGPPSRHARLAASSVRAGALHCTTTSRATWVSGDAAEWPERDVTVKCKCSSP